MEVEPFSVPLDPPLSTASATIDRRQGFLVRLDHAGDRGVGEATPLPGWTESLGACRDAIDRAVAAADELDWGVALGRLDAPAARHGLSLALADARAKTESQPLYRSLGATAPVERVPVNGTIGDGDPPAVRESAARLVETGLTCLKLKVGAGPLQRDRERIEALRAAAGAGVEVRLDANGAWDRETAAAALDVATAFDVAYVEQPLPADNLAGLAELRGRGVAVAVDETLIEHDIASVRAADAADVVVCKPMVLGGPDRAVSVAREARNAGIEPVVSTTVDAAVARTAAVHVAAAVPDVRASGLATGDRLVTDLCADPAPVTDGAVAVPDGPGLGLRGEPQP
jgi:o-succinylbenzoate synthase